MPPTFEYFLKYVASSFRLPERKRVSGLRRIRIFPRARSAARFIAKPNPRLPESGRRIKGNRFWSARSWLSSEASLFPMSISYEFGIVIF